MSRHLSYTCDHCGKTIPDGSDVAIELCYWVGEEAYDFCGDVCLLDWIGTRYRKTYRQACKQDEQ